MSLDLRNSTDTRVQRSNDPSVRDSGATKGTGEFGRMVNRPVNMAQRNAQERATGWKVLESAMHKQYATVGMKTSLNRYESYRTLQKTVDGMKKSGWDQQINDPVLQGTRDQFAMNSESNMKYLELQQKFQDESRQHTALSNLMKARHDSTKASINEIK